MSKIEVAYQEAVALKKQEELIREEEAACLAEIELRARRGALDKEKKSKKKQGKQKRNNRKSKDKGKDDKPGSIARDKIEQEILTERKDLLAAATEMALEKSDAVEDVSDMSDSVECAPEILPPESEDRDVSPVNWDTDTSEVNLPTEASGSGISGLSSVQNGTEGRSSSLVDDSSSTCSSDSVPSVVISVPQIGNSHCQKNIKSPNRRRNHQDKLTTEPADSVSGKSVQPSKAVPDAGNQINGSQSSKAVESLSQAAHRSFQDRVVNGAERDVAKEEETDSLRGKYSAKDADVEVFGDRAACVTRSPSKKIPSIAPKFEPKINIPSELIVKKSSSDSPRKADRRVCQANSAENAATLISDTHKFATPKPTEKPSRHQMHVSEKPPTQPVMVSTDKPSMPSMPAMSRPLSAPLTPGPLPAVSVVSMVQTTPVLARSVSAAGRLGPEPTASAIPSYAPQSYRNAIVGGSVTGSSPAYTQNHSASSVVNASISYSQAPAQVSTPLFLPHISDRIELNQIRPSFSFGMVNQRDMLQNGPLWVEPPQRESNRNLPGDRASLLKDMQTSDIYNSMYVRSQDQFQSGFPAGTSGRQSHVSPDDFPHLDIINDLLDDEHGIGNLAKSSSGDRSFSNGPHYLNRHFSFPGDPGTSSGLGLSTSSCRFERARSYQHDGFQHSFGASVTCHDTLTDMIPQASSRVYVNGQIDGLIPNQWQMAGSDLPFLSSRNTDSDGYPYNMAEYQNLTVGVNGYTVFRPSNGL